MKIPKIMFFNDDNGAKGETRTLKRNIWQSLASLKPCFICQLLPAIASFCINLGKKLGRDRGGIIHEAAICLPLILILTACHSPQQSQWHGGLLHVYRPAQASRANIILHQGHNTFDGKYGKSENLAPFAERLADLGFTVYGMEMPPEPHKDRPLSDFTAPVYRLLDQIGPSYMIGLSGGGWTTTVVTATDSRIIKGFSVAGDAPLDVWNHPEKRDAEQFLVDYRTLYSQAVSRLYHFYNWDDACCFDHISGDTGYQYTTVYDNSGQHEISLDAQDQIIGIISHDGVGD